MKVGRRHCCGLSCALAQRLCILLRAAARLAPAGSPGPCRQCFLAGLSLASPGARAVTGRGQPWPWARARAGPIRTGIWEGGLGSVAGFEGAAYERALGKLRRFAEREWASPAWFLEPEAVGERVWQARRARPPPLPSPGASAGPELGPSAGAAGASAPRPLRQERAMQRGQRQAQRRARRTQGGGPQPLPSP